MRVNFEKFLFCGGSISSRFGSLLIREFKHDVYGRRQTPKVNSDFLFFSCNPYINHTKIKCRLLLFTANTNTLILLHGELKTDSKSFIFAVCRKRHA